jgi:tryptophan-rich sensory protein
MNRAVVGLIGTFIVAIYAVVSGRLVTTDQQWFRALSKPSWQPPRSVPGLIWPYNFAMLIVATWVVATRLSSTQHLVWLSFLALSAVATFLWAWLFFKHHSLLLSAAALVCVSLLTVPLLVISFRASLVLGVAFVPYQV